MIASAIFLILSIIALVFVCVTFWIGTKMRFAFLQADIDRAQGVKKATTAAQQAIKAHEEQTQ